MQFTKNALNNALDFLLPKIKKASDKPGQESVNISKKMEMVMHDFFIDAYTGDCLDHPPDRRMAIFIVQQAAYSLTTDGQFNYGNVEWNYDRLFYATDQEFNEAYKGDK